MEMLLDILTLNLTFLLHSFKNKIAFQFSIMLYIMFNRRQRNDIKSSNYHFNFNFFSYFVVAASGFDFTFIIIAVFKLIYSFNSTNSNCSKCTCSFLFTCKWFCNKWTVSVDQWISWMTNYFVRSLNKT